MKLSTETLEILKSFAAINQSMLFKPGKKLKTVSSQKTILAQATVQETFTKECAIYDLNEFLGMIGSFEDPEIEFEDNYVKIKNGKANATFVYAAPATITTPPEKDIVIPNVDVAFTVEKDAMSSALKAAGMMNLPEVALEGKDGVVSLNAIDSRTVGGNHFSYPVGKASTNYRMIFKVENLKMLPRDYDLSVSVKGISHFKSKTGDVEYWIPAERSSTIDK